METHLRIGDETAAYRFHQGRFGRIEAIDIGGGHAAGLGDIGNRGLAVSIMAEQPLGLLKDAELGVLLLVRAVHMHRVMSEEFQESSLFILQSGRAGKQRELALCSIKREDGGTLAWA